MNDIKLEADNCLYGGRKDIGYLMKIKGCKNMFSLYLLNYFFFFFKAAIFYIYFIGRITLMVTWQQKS